MWQGSIVPYCLSKEMTKSSFKIMIIIVLSMLQSVPNPVYLFQGIVLRRGAKGTGMKSIELALSMCDIVDIYGFTVDPGYTEWLVFIVILLILVSIIYVTVICI